jgi:hypothetical protein
MAIIKWFEDMETGRLPINVLPVCNWQVGSSATCRLQTGSTLVRPLAQAEARSTISNLKLNR